MVYANLKTDVKGPQEVAVEKYFDNQSCTMILKKKISDEFGTANFSELKGDALAKLKVKTVSQNQNCSSLISIFTGFFFI